MKKLLILAALAALCMPAVRAQQTPAAPLRVIFDTDMGNDVDDPLALDMLYKAVDRGEITLLGILSSKDTEFSPRYIDMMNTWYGYPEIPVGRVRDGVVLKRDDYARAVCESGLFPRSRRDRDYGDPVTLYRRLLAESGDETLPSSEGPLAIRGTEGLVMSYAKCCTPIPGDPIVGYLSAGKGMVVHMESCRNIVDIRHNPEKCIQLNWAKDVTGEFNVELRVELEHQRGLIALLASSVNAADGNIEKISMDERDGRISVVQLVVSVHDRVHLARVIKKLRALKGVMRITRVRA